MGPLSKYIDGRENGFRILYFKLSKEVIKHTRTNSAAGRSNEKLEYHSRYGVVKKIF